MTKFPPGMYRMRNGERAEVFAERDGELWGRRQLNSEVWSLWRWVVDGTEANGCQHKFDLISPWVEERVPFEYWHNVYQDSLGKFYIGSSYHTKEKAEQNASKEAIGPAIKMIEATPITEHAGEMLAFLEQQYPVRAHANMTDCHCSWCTARNLIAKAKP